jgi:NAD(P)-dependent dehydrogenase (short-subunit alcohol dehydrogenase family)
MTGQVAGKVALVTGGASGIGAAVAELLAREGAFVAVTDIDELGGPGIVAGIRKAGGEAIFLPQDVTSEARWIEVVAEVEKRYGRLDILVSNAGIGIAVPSITDMTLEDWRRQNAINLDGVFLSVKHCLPAMRRTGGGSIIMMSSLARPAVRQVDRDGMRIGRRRHSGQLGPSRHYRHADMGQNSNGSRGAGTERADRS